MVTMSSLLNDPTALLVGATAVSLLVGGLVLSLGRKKEKPSEQTTAAAAKSPSAATKTVSSATEPPATAATGQQVSTTSSSQPEALVSSLSNDTATNASSNLVDVWAERRQRGIMPASMDRKGGVETDKPFKSSYYYAHNNPDTTGGYKDGLRMEDYAMNGPRLLSKGGKKMTVDKASGTSSTSNSIPSAKDDPLSESQISTNEQVIITRSVLKKKRTVPITQYLWDDEGGKTATIIIDKLPGGLRSTDPPVTWSAAQVKNVHAILVDGEEGLRVEVETALDWDYVLQVERLFASVTAVQTVVKPKRLRVKLTKKSTSIIMSSYDKWPHPHKKKV